MSFDPDVAGPRIEQFSGPGYRGCRLSGEIDFTSAGAVQSALLGMILPGGGAMVVDLTRITFLDSSGLGVLVQAYRVAAEQDTRLLLVASEPVRKLLRLTGLDTVLETYDEMSAAEAALSD
ncbi:MAG TPA: STAS domain-containing protein [Mycobacteriales bacterium]